ncbi:MAG: carboxypeptidase M32, partial [Gaiellaceae bacterium]
RRSDDFASFLPALRTNLDLRKRYVELFVDDFDEPYDVLLDDYERGFTTAETESVLERLKRELVPLLEAAREAEGEELEGPFPVEGQRAFARELLDRLGFESRSWRLDHSEHPFTASLALADIRLTSHFKETHLGGVFAAIHEFGHGLYERQISPSLARPLLAGGASAALHESQSRMWENLVGRSRPFWQLFYPRAQAAFPEQLRNIELDAFIAGINRVKPSLIRIKADEVTYGMHIILRFELEQDLVDGRVAVGDLPEVWNERMHEYLGVDVPNDAQGVLQDTHWASGHIGYFSTYLLGTVMSVQLWEKILEDVPDLEDQIERGEFAALREWLGEHVHRHGRKYAPQELLRRATGSTIDPKPYLAYLRSKYGAGVTA